MNKMVILLILLNIINIITQDITEACLSINNDTINSRNLSSCRQQNSNETTKDNKIIKDYIYCCLLTLSFKNNTDNRFCITVKGDKDIIDERIEMLKMQLNVEDATIDCLSNYLYRNILYIILLLIMI